MLRVVDGDVELKVCDRYEPDEVEAQVKSPDGVRTYFWRAAEGLEIGPGDVLSTSTLAGIFSHVEKAELPAPQVGDNVAIRLSVAGDPQRKLFSFVVNADMLEGKWVSTWGDISESGQCADLSRAG